MIYKFQMLFLWLFERLSEWFSYNDDAILFWLWLWGVGGGIMFILIDIMPLGEGLRFGWFYSIFRIPTYLSLLSLIGVILWGIAQTLFDWFVKQYRDYQAFVISGGKEKPKNDEE